MCFEPIPFFKIRDVKAALLILEKRDLCFYLF